MKYIVSLIPVVLISCFASAQDVNHCRYLLDIEKYKEANICLQKNVAINPNDPRAYYLLGDSYLRKSNTDSATFFFTKGVEQAPKAPINYIGLGKAVYATNQVEAETHFSKALELSKNKDMSTATELASFYLNNKQADKALDALAPFLKKEANSPVLYLLAGDAYLQKNNGNQALEYYERKALPINQNLPETYLKIGRLYSRTRNYEMAMQYYNKAIEKDPNYSPAHKEIAEVYFKAGLYKKAIASYEKYLGIADKDAESDFRYASFLFMNKDYENTLSILNTLKEKQKDNYLLYRLLAYSNYETGQTDQGLNNMKLFFEKAKPENYLASDFEYMAKLSEKKGDRGSAIDNYEKAIQMSPENYDLYIELGNLHFMNKDFTKASTAYEGKLSKTQGKPNDYLNYGKMLYYQEEFVKADSIFTLLSQLIPQLPHGYLWKAKAREQMDTDSENGKAQAAYERFIETSSAEEDKYKSDLIKAYSYLGACYSQKDEIEKSATAWKKVQELDPNNGNAREALKNYK